jgi:hypothetical protein
MKREQRDPYQDLLDRDAIEQVLLRYASSIDDKDFARLRTILCEDIRGQYGETVIEGADRLVRWIARGTDDRDWQHHFVSVYHIDLTGEDEADALTYHMSHHTRHGEPDRCTRTIARYRDHLRRVDGRWLIAEKVMEVGWTDMLQRPPSGG